MSGSYGTCWELSLGAEPQGKEGTDGAACANKLIPAGSDGPRSAWVFPGDLGAHLGSSGTRSSVLPALGRGNKESLGRGPPGSSEKVCIEAPLPCDDLGACSASQVQTSSRNWPGDSAGSAQRSLRMKRLAVSHRLKIYLPAFSGLSGAEKGTPGCGASDSWLGDSSVEFLNIV